MASAIFFGGVLGIASAAIMFAVLPRRIAGAQMFAINVRHLRELFTDRSLLVLGAILLGSRVGLTSGFSLCPFI